MSRFKDANEVAKKFLLCDLEAYEDDVFDDNITVEKVHQVLEEYLEIYPKLYEDKLKSDAITYVILNTIRDFMYHVNYDDIKGKDGSTAGIDCEMVQLSYGLAHRIVGGIGSCISLEY